MKRFTIKDFIDFHSPCICRRYSSLYINICSNRKETKHRAYLNGDFLEVLFKRKYSSDENLYFAVNIKTNEFEINNNVKREYYDFFIENKVSLILECNCKSMIVSNYLELVFDECSKNFIKPLTVAEEMYVMTVYSALPIETTYILRSNYELNQTIIHIIDKGNTNTEPICVPLIPFNKFRTKENLLKKIMTCITFF